MSTRVHEQEAQRRIEFAQQGGRQELNLSGLKLTTLPESLDQLTQLTELNLCCNNLTTLVVRNYRITAS